ncbi:MAG: hypothetical protein SAL07_10160 [Oscillatoria sp. PMC 1051.18]|nr:hypothetical protein [Oscillatoria sp. PMC 1050.18]MEC5030265.1 hypothetical protein [Oscillatoria sp. PMC 1051.18]
MKVNLLSQGLGVVSAALCLVSASLPAQAFSVTFSFDTTPSGTIDSPTIGTGTFSYDGDLGNGTFGLTTLPNYSFNFNFGGTDFFDNANIATPVANVLVQISESNGTRFVNFGGTGGGPFGGSIDFVTSGNPNFNGLTFQPGFGSFYQTNNPGNAFGDYVASTPATAVPFEFSPGLGLLFLGGLWAMNLFRMKKAEDKQKKVASLTEKSEKVVAKV